MKRLLSLLAILFIAISASATTYYVDADGGSNADDGLTPDTAWRDLSRFRDIGAVPGDVLLLKRGCVWSGTRLYMDDSGIPGNPIKYGAYGTGELPIITSVGEIPGADIAGNWTQSGTNRWTLPLALIDRPGRLFADGVELLRSHTLSTLGEADNEGAIGEWFYDTLNNELLLEADQNPTLVYSSLSGSRHFYTALVDGASYLEFTDINFQGGSGASLAIIGGQHIVVKDCELGWNGNTGLLLLNNSTRAASEITVEENMFNSGFTFSYGYGSERGCGDGVRLRNGATNCEIFDNDFLNWAHNAIELLGTSTGAAGVNNNRIYDNEISAASIPYAHPIGADGYYGKCQNNEIFRNWARDCRTAAQLNGNDNWYHHNIFQGMRKSPSKEQATAHGIILGVYGDGLVCEDNRYDHNLIIDTDEAGFLISGFGFSNKVQGNILRNNIAYDTGKSPYENDYEIGTSIILYDTNEDGLGPNTYQNNLFYSPDPVAVPVYLQDNDAYYTADEFNQRNSVDGNTVENNVDFEPRFMNVGSNNFTPADNSQMINAGLDTGLAEDFAGNPRLVGVAPDIGPYESSLLVSLPVSWLDITLDCSSNERILRWQVQEENNAYFTIERSSDAKTWQELERVASEAIGNESRWYQFVDKNPLPGRIYYRVRQTDWDGRFTYSSIVSCADAGAQNMIRLIPQEGKQYRIVIPEGTQLDELELTLFSNSGQQLATFEAVEVLDLSRFPAAMCYVQVRLGTTQQALRLVLPY
ncbi:MAG: right-handed parallel beta-helix repeat-containing protein [Bacteroidota bacterium]